MKYLPPYPVQPQFGIIHCIIRYNDTVLPEIMISLREQCTRYDFLCYKQKILYHHIEVLSFQEKDDIEDLFLHFVNTKCSRINHQRRPLPFQSVYIVTVCSYQGRPRGSNSALLTGASQGKQQCGPTRGSP